MKDMFKVKCVNCSKEEWHIVMQDKWICEECLEKEQSIIPSYFDDVRGN